MKTAVAVVLVALTLSLCNMMGRRGNTNTNGNSDSSSEMAESSPSPSPAEEIKETAAAPPTVTQGVPRAGEAPAAVPGPPPLRANQNSAAGPPPPPKTISGGVLNGKSISKPQPTYPAMAKAVKASGTVTVQVLVDESRNVVTARAVSGHSLLQQSAVVAARQAKFSPTIVGGQRVKVTGVITYNFVAQ